MRFNPSPEKMCFLIIAKVIFLAVLSHSTKDAAPCGIMIIKRIAPLLFSAYDDDYDAATDGAVANSHLS